jgi:hypothetical protein
LDMKLHRGGSLGKLYTCHKKKVSWEDTWAFIIQDCKSKSTLLAFHFRLSSTLSPKIEMEKEHMSGVPYANIVGSNIWCYGLHSSRHFTYH